jgi:predicted ATPase/DNA-binding SARP family transcriptional activator
VPPSADLEFRILGPLEVCAGGESLSLGGAKQRATLAVLLVHANEPVSTDRLVDALWGSRPPGTAKTALQGYITGLRRSLEPGRKKRGAAEVLVTTPAGYVLRVGDGALDRDRFEALTANGREALADDKPAEAAALCRSALGLWRGPALADFAYEAWAQSESERLQELRLRCLEERLEAELRLGHDSELIPELEALAAEHPLREGPRAQLMLALYRAGRQAEALGVYQQTRRTLVEELGIDPSPELRELEAAILRQDEDLAAAPVRALPEGTVTLLSTDIEGSTRLLHELGTERYAAALQEHRHLVRDACSRHGGVEVDTQGDAFLVSFPTAPAAVRAAEAATGALASGPIRVRIGIHSGAPLLTTEGYVGVDLHRVSRIAAAGHGGQILLSESSARLLEQTDLVDLGEHRLKDLAASVRVYQLGDGEFPALRTLHQTNLPVQPTPLVGREQELAEVLALLTEARLVTLTGPGGSGKTRLALQAAADLVESFPDGVWWVSLASLRDAELVESTIAQIVGARDGLAEHLRVRRALLLLDNFEQLLEAAQIVADLLTAAPDLRVIVTSRERLGLAAEQEFELRSMAPAEAVALFAARARRLRSSFEPTEAVDEICRRLDGLPLAIELAAARIKLLDPEQILERLGHRLELLTAGARDAPERHKTLRATLAWSHTLLTDTERELFARLAVFAGSFSLDAAEEICAAQLDTLASLVDKNLLRETVGGRLFMLETIKEYACERFEAAGEESEVRGRHAEYFLVFAERAGAELRSESQGRWFGRLQEEHANLRAALTWLHEAGRGQDQLRLATAIFEFWSARAPKEGLAWLEAGLAADREASASLRSNALSRAAFIAVQQRDEHDARAMGEQAITLAEEAGDLEALADALHAAGVVATFDDDYERAEGDYRRALATARRLGDELRAAWEIGNLAELALMRGEHRRASSLSRRSTRLLERCGDRKNFAIGLFNAGLAALALGDVTEATAQLIRSLELFDELGDQVGAVLCLEGFAGIASVEGQADRAARLLGAGEALREEHGLVLGVAERQLHERTLREVKLAGSAELIADGRAVTLEQAVGYALRRSSSA